MLYIQIHNGIRKDNLDRNGICPFFPRLDHIISVNYFTMISPWLQNEDNKSCPNDMGFSYFIAKTCSYQLTPVFKLDTCVKPVGLWYSRLYFNNAETASYFRNLWYQLISPTSGSTFNLPSCWRPVLSIMYHHYTRSIWKIIIMSS